MIKVLNTEGFTKAFLDRSTKKSGFDPEIVKTAADVLADVRANGDKAVKTYITKFDGTAPEDLLVSNAELTASANKVSAETREALEAAAANIRSFHEKQLQTSKIMQADQDIVMGQLYRPIEAAGIYVPGGKAVYPSTILMNAIPAKLAGVQKIVMVTPVKNGEAITPVLAAAAQIAGVHEIYKVGGIQAIGALTYGTETIPAVDKIVGPGNAYVAAAKMLVFGEVGIDMVAGPSEVAIIADEQADPAFIAADLLSQAEHDEQARVFLFTDSAELADKVKEAIEAQIISLPRQEIAAAALQGDSALVVTASAAESFRLSNLLAPEHLEIQMSDPLAWLGSVTNAGSVFLGKYAPTALGDYYGGTNHVLPTVGTARFSSGLSVDDFIKKSTYTYYSKQALANAAPHIIRLAEEEQLQGHGLSVAKRLS